MPLAARSPFVTRKIEEDIMPELPEVETVVRGLQPLSGLQVTEVTLFDGAKHVYDTEQIVGETLMEVRRYGKYLLFHFSSDLVMISHLRMTGQYVIAANKGEKEKVFHKHSHVLFSFSDGRFLLFNDQRRFGTIEVLSASAVPSYFSSRKLGPDALLELPDFETFERLLKRKKNMPIKTTLLDQSVLMGLGNIYAQELCFLAGVHPATPSCKVPESSLRLIHKSIVPLLEKAIEFNGTTFDGKYVNTNGDSGAFSAFLSVYGQKVCKSCSHDTVKIKLNGRGTYYCPSCQK